MKEYKFSSILSAKSFLKKMVEKDLNSQTNKYGKATLILPGGNSIKNFYRTISQANVNWGKVFIGLSDERLVPLNHESSNERQLKELFLSFITERNYLPLESNLIESIKNYPPVTILSMGEDGHVASLFPDEADYWDVKDNNYLFYETKFQSINRISISKSLLILSLGIYVLVIGEEKIKKYYYLKYYYLRNGQGPYKFLFDFANFILC